MKIGKALLVIAVAGMGLAGCSGKSGAKSGEAEDVKTDALVCKMANGPVSVSIHMDAVNDNVVKIRQVGTFDIQNMTEEQRKRLEQPVNQAEQEYKSLKFVDYKFVKEDKKWTENITMNITPETVPVIIEKKLMQISGGDKVKFISLKQSAENYKKQGWECTTK